MHPNHLPGRHNRDFDRQPNQAWGRSGQGYGKTGPVEYAPWHPREGNPTRDNIAGLSIWITAAIISLTCLVVGWLGVTGRI